MSKVWPRPERLLPPRLVSALEAVQKGESAEAVKLLHDSDRQDALTRDAATVVRGLAALEENRIETARRVLRPLLRRADPALALQATFGLVEINLRDRRYTSAAALVERARRHATDDAVALVLESTALRLQLLRTGNTAPERVAALPLKLRRQHPAAVHASVHLLRAENALLLGDFAAAVEAEGQARSWVRTAQRTLLQKQHADIRTLLDEAPFAEVEDWQLAQRAVSRAQVAQLETQQWQLWLDFLHLQLRWRPDVTTKATTIHFATAPDLWNVLARLAQAPHQRLDWSRAASEFDVQDKLEAKGLVQQLNQWLEEHGGEALITATDTGCQLSSLNFVYLHPTSAIPHVQQLLLGILAEHPGIRAAELEGLLDIPRRTLVRHLATLRSSGFVRLIGGGRDSCYVLI